MLFRSETPEPEVQVTPSPTPAPMDALWAYPSASAPVAVIEQLPEDDWVRNS